MKQSSLSWLSRSPQMPRKLRVPKMPFANDKKPKHWGFTHLPALIWSKSLDNLSHPSVRFIQSLFTLGLWEILGLAILHEQCSGLQAERPQALQQTGQTIRSFCILRSEMKHSVSLQMQFYSQTLLFQMLENFCMGSIKHGCDRMT